MAIALTAAFLAASLSTAGLLLSGEAGKGEAKESGSISGRIIDGDGKGIEGAKVFVHRQLGGPGMSQLESLTAIVDLSQRLKEIREPAISASDGSYRIDGLDVSSYYTVQAISSGRSPGERRDIRPASGGLDIVLAAGSELTGIVLSPDGDGIEGAKVQAYANVDSSDIFTIIETRSRPPLDSAASGAGGRFRLDTLGAGTYNFMVQAPGYQEGRFLKVSVRRGKNPEQRFALSRGLRIAGKAVSPTGEPVAGARVRATRMTPDEPREQIFIRFDDGSILTDGQGRFSFDTLEPGKYVLLAWHPDFASEQIRDVATGSVDLTIEFSRGVTVSGQVVEAGTGKPIAGATISATDLQDLRKEAVADKEGRFRIRGLSAGGPGKRFLNVQAEGYLRLANIEVPVRAGKDVEDLKLQIEPAAVARGRVVDGSGRGVARARVTALAKSPESFVPATAGTAMTDGEGRFRISGIEGGKETFLSVWARDFLEGKSMPFTLKPGESMDLPVIVLRPGGTAEGVVVDPDGHGLPGIQVMVREEGSTAPDPARSTLTDAQGRFAIRGLRSGSLDLVARSASGLEGIASGVKVAEGEVSKDVRIVIKKGVHVKGKVVDGEGRPVAGAKLTVHDISADGIREVRAVSGEDGSFALENIQGTGDVEVEVVHPEHLFWTGNAAVNSEDLKVILRKLGGVRGTVVDPDGKPVRSFTVQTVPSGRKEGGRKAGRARSISDPEGRFEEKLPPGVYNILIRAPGFADFTLEKVKVGEDVKDLEKAVLRKAAGVRKEL